MKKIAIIYGGPSSEHEVSISTARSIFENLNKTKYQISLMPIGKDLSAELINNPKSIESKISPGNQNIYSLIPKLKQFDIAFLATHGQFGEDGTLQALLETHSIPYTGSNPYASRLCMDKYRSSLVASSIKGLKIPTTELIDAKQISKILPQQLQKLGEVVLKPNRLGSSVATYIIANQTPEDKIEDILADINENFINEQFVIQEAITPNIELSCGCLESKTGEITYLPPIEIQPVDNTFYNYEAKYQQNASKHFCPPKNISKDKAKQISKLAAQIHTLLGCSTYSRSDFLIKDEQIFYLETNSLPGMTPTSLLPDEARAKGMSFSELLDFIINNS